MSFKAPDPPPPIDPAALVNAQAEANRVSFVSPFGNLLFLDTSAGTPTAAGPSPAPGGFLSAVAPQGMDETFPLFNRGDIMSLSDAGFAAKFAPRPVAAPVQVNPTAPVAGGLLGIPGLEIPGGTSLTSPTVAFLDLPDSVDASIRAVQDALPTSAFEVPDTVASSERAEQAAFDRLMALLNPQVDRNRNRLIQELANTGNPVGSEIFKDRFGIFDEGVAEARERLALTAVREGDLAADRDLRRALTLRAQPFNELNAILTSSQVPVPGVAPLDVLGPASLAIQQQNANFANASADNRGLLGGLLGLGGSILAAPASSAAGAGLAALGGFISSRRFKTGGKPAGPILDRVEKLDVERWRYTGQFEDGVEHIGPYAEDFRDLFGVGDGVTINAIDIIGVCLQAIKELSAEVNALKSQSAEAA